MVKGLYNSIETVGYSIYKTTSLCARQYDACLHWHQLLNNCICSLKKRKSRKPAGRNHNWFHDSFESLSLCRIPIGQTTCCCWRLRAGRRMWLDSGVINLCTQRMVNPDRRWWWGYIPSQWTQTHIYADTPTDTHKCPFKLKLTHTTNAQTNTPILKDLYSTPSPLRFCTRSVKERLVKQRSALLRPSLSSFLVFVLDWLAICLEMN